MTAPEQWVVMVHYTKYADQPYGPWDSAEEATAWADGGLTHDPAMSSWEVVTVASIDIETDQDGFTNIRFPL